MSYFQSLYTFVIHIPGYALQVLNPMYLRVSTDFAYHLDPLKRKPYNNLNTTRLLPCLSPNSSPTIIYT